MTSQEWAKLNPLRNKQLRLNWRIKHRAPCRLCGTKMPYPSIGHKYCHDCKPESKRVWGRAFRATATAAFHAFKEKTGCARCGYNKFGGALDFDHIDPATKSMRILAKDWTSRKTRPLVLAELKKCQLLCSNCHREKTFREDRKPLQIISKGGRL